MSLAPARCSVTCGVQETLRRAAEAAGWATPKPGPGFGRGIALGQRPQGRAVSIARVTVDAQGHATLSSSVPDTGVGFYSVGRQVVAEDLGLAAEAVGMTRLDTDAVPFETGAGAGTSVGAAHAALGAAQDVRQQLAHLAAEFYVWPQERIVFGKAASSWKTPRSVVSRSRSWRRELSPRSDIPSSGR